MAFASLTAIVTEPTSDEDLSVASLILTTSSGGPVDSSVFVDIIDMSGTASMLAWHVQSVVL